MRTFVLDFHMSGMIRQKVIIIAAEYSEEMVIDGLNSGELETTIGHDGVETGAETITDCNGRPIARIEMQRCIEGSVFHNFGDSTDLDIDMLGSDVEEDAANLTN